MDDKQLSEGEVVSRARMKILAWVFGFFTAFLVYYLASLMGVIDSTPMIALSL